MLFSLEDMQLDEHLLPSLRMWGRQQAAKEG